MLNQEGQQLAARLHPIFKRWRISQAILFGSLARGEASRHSDVDLLLIQDTPARWLDRYDGILKEIGQVVPGRDIDLLIYTPAELQHIAERPFITTALREGVVIYESDQEPASS